LIAYRVAIIGSIRQVLSTTNATRDFSIGAYLNRRKSFSMKPETFTSSRIADGNTVFI
jgi:hypothetical protein